MKLSAYIGGIGVLGPGLADWHEAAAVLSGAKPYSPAPTVLTSPELLPPTEQNGLYQQWDFTNPSNNYAGASPRAATQLPLLLCPSHPKPQQPGWYTTYGGNGVQTFALPNLQGQVPAHVGPGFVLGQAIGEVNHTLIVNEMPAHSHVIMSDIVEPGGATEHAALPSVAAAIGPSNPDGLYATSVGSNSVTLAASVLSSVGG